MLHHRFSVFGPCIELSPLGVRPGEVLHDLNPLLAAAAAIVRLWVLLRFILSRTVVAVHRFVKPQLVRLIIHLQSHFNWAAFFLVFFVALAEISLFGEVNRVVTRLITRGVVVLRLLDSGLRIWSRIGVSRSAYNESYPESDGRSGTHVPIIWQSELQVYC